MVDQVAAVGGGRRCLTCHGKGTVEVIVRKAGEPETRQTVTCPACGGAKSGTGLMTK